MGHSRPLSLHFRLFNTVDSKQMLYICKRLPMTGFEPWTSGVRSSPNTWLLFGLFINNIISQVKNAVAFWATI